MKNSEVIEIIRNECTVKAPDLYNKLDFERADEYKNGVPPVTVVKKYVTAAVIYVAACIAVILILPFIIGGGDHPDDPVPAVSGDETTDGYTDDTVYDLGGEEFVILCDSLSDTMLIDSLLAEYDKENVRPEVEAGYVLAKKKAERFEAVEEKFGINVKVEAVSDPAFELTARSQAGQMTNSAVFARGSYLADAALDGYLYDMNDIESMDLSKGYWMPNAVESLTVADRLFFTSGMISFDPLKYSDYVVFNNELIQSLDLESPYDLVKDGTWTYEAFIEMIMAAQKDLNGDGEIGLEDRHGGYMASELLEKMWRGPQCEKNDDGTYTYTPYSEKLVAAYTKYKPQIDKVNYAFDEHYWDIWNFEYTDNLVYEKFREGNALFMPNEYLENEIGLLIGMNSYMGIAPHPATEAGDRYYTEMSLSANLLSVPSCVSDPEITGMILDYLAYTSEKVLYNEYSERCLRNEENGQNNKDMLDIILDSAIYDWANLYIPHEYDVRAKMLTAGSFGSVYKRYVGKIQEIIDNTVDRIKLVKYNKISDDEEDVVFGYRNLYMYTEEYAPDAERKNEYAIEYMYSVAKEGEITLMPELAVMLDSKTTRLLAVSFTGFKENEAVFVDTEELRSALIGDKKYIPPNFSYGDAYEKNVPSNEIVLYMTADEFKNIQAPEGMKVIAGLAEFPYRQMSVSSYLPEIRSGDTVIVHMYYDLYELMTYDDELTPPSDDKWDIFKYDVERYYDLEIPKEYEELLADGTILSYIKKNYSDIDDFVVIPELCKIQMRMDGDTLSRLMFLDDQYVIKVKKVAE